MFVIKNSDFCQSSCKQKTEPSGINLILKSFPPLRYCRGPEGVLRQVRRHRGGDGDEGPDDQAEQGIRLRHLLGPQQRRQGARARAPRPRRQKGERGGGPAAEQALEMGSAGLSMKSREKWGKTLYSVRAILRTKP